MKVKITGNKIAGKVYHELELGKKYIAENYGEMTEDGLARMISNQLILERDFEILED